jgi:hypothetical protein
VPQELTKNEVKRLAATAESRENHLKLARYARGPHQMAQMTKRLAVKGFDGLNDGLRTDRVTLTIPANFMLIATFDKHPCMQSGRLNLSGKDSAVTLRLRRKVAIGFTVRFRCDLPSFMLYLIK